MKSKKAKKEAITEFFSEYIEGYMFGDIEKAKKASTNYLIALGLMTITEFFGGLLTGNLSVDKQSKTNFNRALTSMSFDGDSGYYCNFQLKGNKFLLNSGSVKSKTEKRGIYEIVRCGLVHDYFIKGIGSSVINDPLMAIEIIPDENIKGGPIPGIWWDNNDNSVKFFTNMYYKDLKAAINDYKNELLVDESPILIKNFFNAIKNLEKRKVARYKNKKTTYWAPRNP